MRAVSNAGASVAAVDVSLIIPVFNEAECIAAVIEEAAVELAKLPESSEIIAVNDGSTDGTGRILVDLVEKVPSLRVLTVQPNSGQSAAFGAGFQGSRGSIVVLMDGDGQNDPADIGKLVDALKDADACCGYRATRRDTTSKRIASRLANGIRRSILHDGVRDTGCSLKAIAAEWVDDLPMTLRGMHRFIPALLRMRGARVVEVAVNHRPRSGGHSKYTNVGRLMETMWDLWAVRWMQKRFRTFRVAEEGE